jgi:hypothetical protein
LPLSIQKGDVVQVILEDGLFIGQKAKNIK